MFLVRYSIPFLKRLILKPLMLKHLILKILLITMSSIMMTTSYASNESLNSITLAVEDNWPPYADSYGQGISTNIVRAAFASVGIELSLHVAPYARVLYEVKKGIAIGGYNVTRQASREQQFLFGKEVLLHAQAFFYFPPNSEEAKSYKNIADIPDGASVGIIIDYEYGDIFDKHKHRFKLVEVSQQKQIISMLTLGRLDAAIMFEAVAQHTLESMHLSTNEIQKGPLNHRSNIHIAFSKFHQHSQYFADKLDQGLMNIKQSGLYYKLLKYESGNVVSKY